MSTDPSNLSSQVFLLRLWAVQQNDGQTAWCGKVQHLTSGEAYLFGNWTDLVAFLEGRLQDLDQPDHTLADDTSSGPTRDGK